MHDIDDALRVRIDNTWLQSVRSADADRSNSDRECGRSGTFAAGQMRHVDYAKAWTAFFRPRDADAHRWAPRRGTRLVGACATRVVIRSPWAAVAAGSAGLALAHLRIAA